MRENMKNALEVDTVPQSVPMSMMIEAPTMDVLTPTFCMMIMPGYASTTTEME